MTERLRADEHTLAARRRAVDELGTSTHWPHNFTVTHRLYPEAGPLGGWVAGFGAGDGLTRFERLTPAQAALV
jgi:hypothetical protein